MVRSRTDKVEQMKKKHQVEYPVLSNRKRWAWLIGIGVALTPIHNTYLTQLSQSSSGSVDFFLPAFGTAVWLIATLWFVADNTETVKSEGFGDKRIWIPLLVIAAAISLSGIPRITNITSWITFRSSIGAGLAPLFMGISLFALYLSSRILGRELEKPLAVGAIAAGAGIIVSGIVAPGILTGGLLFETNYDIATGYVLLGSALFIHKRQWIIVLLAVIAMFFCAAPEALFALVVCFAVVIYRKDWSAKLAISVAVMIAIVGITAIFHIPQNLYSYTAQTIQTTFHYDYVPAPELKTWVPADGVTVSPFGIRWLIAGDALSDIQPLGDGYNLTAFTTETVHNIPVIIIQQLGWPGMLAGIAWVWVCVMGIKRSKRKYAWVLFSALCIFDHFLWTQWYPLFWLLVGISFPVDETIKTDLIFDTGSVITGSVITGSVISKEGSVSSKGGSVSSKGESDE